MPPNRRKTGDRVPPLDCLPNDPVPSTACCARWGFHSPIGSHKHCPNRRIPPIPGLTPQKRGWKKVPQTVPTGRVIKYPKKCALFCPPGAPRGRPGRPKKGTPPGTPKMGGQILYLIIYRPGKGPFWAHFWGSPGPGKFPEISGTRISGPGQGGLPGGFPGLPGQVQDPSLVLCHGPSLSVNH